ncbi:GPO family capsid scaffolding protein [Pseudomonas aeruginosa]|nr:GPO family capsid scaffolding protein [Pseudomonas aeruginosa]MCU9088392.1 GPO family capsid scaffolding protein [Pseudomonas aeruginosa]
MPQNLITGWIQVATSGATIDGRTIEAQDLRDMAETYSTATYTAVIRYEHMRYYGNFGDVVALKAEDLADGKVGLFAQLRPNMRLLELNKEGQALFTSVEIQPNFANTGKAYLNAMAVTDEPASLGTQRLHFSRRNATADNFFAAPVRLPDLDECLPDDDAESAGRAFFASLGRLLPGFNKSPATPKDESTPMDPKTVQAFAAAVEKLGTVANSLETSAATFAAQKPAEPAAPASTDTPATGITAEQFNSLQTSLTELTEKFNTALNQGQGKDVPATTGAVDNQTEVVY